MNNFYRVIHATLISLIFMSGVLALFALHSLASRPDYYKAKPGCTTITCAVQRYASPAPSSETGSRKN